MSDIDASQMSGLANAGPIPDLPAADRSETARWLQRCMRRAAFASTTSETSNSFTSQANRIGNSLASKREIGLAPAAPPTSSDQASSTGLPIGQTTPRPVTTTRRPMDTVRPAYAAP
jgi:hypothetical protein